MPNYGEVDIAVSGEGSTKMADEDLCRAIGEDLQRQYPNYPWMVGVNHQAGTIVIDIGLPKPIGLENFAYLLHTKTCFGPGGQKRVMRAGGELLERFGLKRGTAPFDYGDKAKEHGFTVDGAKYDNRKVTPTNSSMKPVM